MKLVNGRDVDYDALMNNIDMMINTLEYDSCRSAGKCKVNVSQLNELYAYKERLAKMLKTNTRKEG